MDELEYQPHLERYRTLFNVSDDSHPETVVAATQNAQYTHALAVFNPLRDWFLKTTTLSDRLRSEDARFYLKFGAGRRLGQMFRAYQHIVSVAEPRRTSPLTHEEQQDLSRDLNVLYMHTRGVLDNFAWCLLYERHPEAAGNINANDVGLFAPRYRAACPCFSEIAQDIDTHLEWHRDVKARRDPVAHRIPLYVPPSQVTPEEATRYRALWEQYTSEVAQLAVDAADATLARMNQLGRFAPYFAHHPASAVIPIYPTVPEDMGHVIKIGNTIEVALLRR